MLEGLSGKLKKRLLGIGTTILKLVESVNSFLTTIFRKVEKVVEA
jgi:hypothetical protein